MKKVADCIETYYNEKNCNCAETLFSAAVEAWDLDVPADAVKSMAGFGGGLASSLTCGAICGAAAAMGYRFIEGEGSGHTAPELREHVHALVEEVRKRLGATDCAVLRPKYFTPEKRCLATIRAVAEAVDEVVPGV